MTVFLCSCVSCSDWCDVKLQRSSLCFVKSKCSNRVCCNYQRLVVGSVSPGTVWFACWCFLPCCTIVCQFASVQPIQRLKGSSISCQRSERIVKVELALSGTSIARPHQKVHIPFVAAAAAVHASPDPTTKATTCGLRRDAIKKLICDKREQRPNTKARRRTLDRLQRQEGRWQVCQESPRNTSTPNTVTTPGCDFWLWTVVEPDQNKTFGQDSVYKSKDDDSRWLDWWKCVLGMGQVVQAVSVFAKPFQRF